jgi:predicted HTH transcriptional regulator
MPIPASNTAGYRRLHERVSYALTRLQEGRDVDFKQSAPWDALQWTIVKTAMAMANLRDGGAIVIGVSEAGETWDPTGISPEHLATYDVDHVIVRLNQYASPHVDLDIVTVAHESRTFLAVYAREFYETPIVCKKNGPDGQGLQEGALYIRPPGFAQTTRLTNAAQMHDLLELAAEKRARRILEVSRRVGLVPAETATQRFNEELGGL